MKCLYACVLGAAILFTPASLRSEPPSGADRNSPLSKWFRTLNIPDSNPPISCCDDSDCRVVPAKFEDGKWFAFLSHQTHKDAPSPGIWIPIPEFRIVQDKQHPSGSAVLCWMSTGPNSARLGVGTLCFVPPGAGG